MIIRRARQADREDVVEVFLACWRDNYAPLFGEQLSRSFDQDSASALWQAALDEDDVLVVDDDELGIVGVTRVVRRSRTAEIGSLYVAPGLQGRGLGRLLLDAAVEHCRELRVERLTLWVFARNEPSVRFYVNQGWQPTGVTRVEADFGEPEVEFLWPGR